MDTDMTGLSAQEVQERRERGEGGTGAKSITKSRAQIIRENVITLFNLLNFIIAGLLFAVGAYTNMLFLAVIFLNIAVGIAQELKAKKLVDELSILNRPGVCVRRGAKDIQIELDEVVKGDLMVLQSGNQIYNDAVVVEGMLEVNESLLTGESDAVVKEAGSELYSGSSVISGKAYAKVTHVGNENYATKLANEVKKEKRVASELLGSMNKVTRFTSMLIVPLGVILFFEAFPAAAGAHAGSGGVVRRGASWYAAEGTGTFNLDFTGDRSHPAGKNEDPRSEYLFAGNTGACRYPVSG